MADAARDFAARRYEQALKKFQQVLSQDENNLNVLYYVGACQIQPQPASRREQDRRPRPPD